MSGPINHLSSDDLKCCIATSASASLSMNHIPGRSSLRSDFDACRRDSRTTPGPKRRVHESGCACSRSRVKIVSDTSSSSRKSYRPASLRSCRNWPIWQQYSRRFISQERARAAAQARSCATGTQQAWHGSAVPGGIDLGHIHDWSAPPPRPRPCDAMSQHFRSPHRLPGAAALWHHASAGRSAGCGARICKFRMQAKRSLH